LGYVPGNPLGELVAKNPVFRLEILDHLDECFLGGPNQKYQEGMKKFLHAGTMLKSLLELEVACLCSSLRRFFMRGIAPP
jgi:hypothetical protein